MTCPAFGVGFTWRLLHAGNVIPGDNFVSWSSNNTARYKAGRTPVIKAWTKANSSMSICSSCKLYTIPSHLPHQCVVRPWSVQVVEVISQNQPPQNSRDSLSLVWLAMAGWGCTKILGRQRGWFLDGGMRGMGSFTIFCVFLGKRFSDKATCSRFSGNFNWAVAGKPLVVYDCWERLSNLLGMITIQCHS